MGKCAEIAFLLQLESSSKRSIVFKEFAWSRSILLGAYTEVPVLVQLEPASECYIFEKLVWPRPILMGERAEITILLQLE